MVVTSAVVLILVVLIDWRLMRVDSAVLIVVVMLVSSDGRGDVRERMYVPRRCGRREDYRDESAEERMPWPTDEVHSVLVDGSPSIINASFGSLGTPPASVVATSSSVDLKSVL